MYSIQTISEMISSVSQKKKKASHYLVKYIPKYDTNCKYYWSLQTLFCMGHKSENVGINMYNNLFVRNYFIIKKELRGQGWSKYVLYG